MWTHLRWGKEKLCSGCDFIGAVAIRPIPVSLLWSSKGGGGGGAVAGGFDLKIKKASASASAGAGAGAGASV